MTTIKTDFIVGTFKYLGFPSDARIEVYQIATEANAYNIRVDLKLSLSPHEGNPTEELRKAVDTFFTQMKETTPIKNEFDKLNKSISKLEQDKVDLLKNAEKEKNDLLQEIERLKAFESYYDLSQGKKKI